MRNVNVVILADSRDQSRYESGVSQLARFHIVDMLDDPARLTRAESWSADLLLHDADWADSFVWPGSLIHISGDCRLASISRAMRRGAFDYLIKPFFPERLIASLESYLHFHDAIRAPSSLTQRDIDRLFSLRYGKLPKVGEVKYCEKMLMRIMDSFAAPARTQTVKSVSSMIGINKSTAARYLKFCVEQGLLSQDLLYGNVGRPELVFRMP